MKKVGIGIVGIISLFMLITACGGTPKAAVSDELDTAIREVSDYLNDNIPQGSKIVILNVQSNSADLSNYIIDELIANTVNDRIFSVVDRAQLDVIRAEQNFQFSGEVDDNMALEVGKFFGAQTIVSGTVSMLGSRYRLTFRALEVQTAQVQGQFNRNINTSEIVTALMKSGGGSGTATAATASGGRTQTGTASGGTATAATPAATPAQPAAPTYKVGDTGPAGGLIFYDKGNSSGGWRYLEAAPADINRKLRGTSESINENDCKERGVGWGKRNTAAIMVEAQKRGGGFGWAAQACDAYTYNGFDDWYLPSRDELQYLYGNLHMQGLGDTRNEWYISSTATSGRNIWWGVDFSNGRQDDNNFEMRVRPVRQF